MLFHTAVRMSKRDGGLEEIGSLSAAASIFTSLAVKLDFSSDSDIFASNMRRDIEGG